MSTIYVDVNAQNSKIETKENNIYENILPPLRLLNQIEEKNLIKSLKDLDFSTKSLLAA